jgi:hypothetical protein
MVDQETIRDEILRQVEQRGPEKTICPSEVARKLETQSTEWRDLMPLVRHVGCELESEGTIQIFQKGSPVLDPKNARGPIRYRIVKNYCFTVNYSRI